MGGAQIITPGHIQRMLVEGFGENAEGFADWLKLSAIPEFAELVTPADGGVFADGSGSGAVAVNGDGHAHAPAATGGAMDARQDPGALGGERRAADLRCAPQSGRLRDSRATPQPAVRARERNHGRTIVW